VELVVVERRFADPVEFEDIQALEDAGSWCLDLHHVRFLKTLFSRDCRRMLCFYEAPDAEAVRLAESKAHVPFDRAWTCANVRINRPESKPPAAEHVVVERVFPEPVQSDFIVNAIRQGGWCLDTHDVSHVESYLSTDGLQMVCHFRAPDAESVRLASRLVGMLYNDIWTASLHTQG
jgi:hypothetical protein